MRWIAVATALAITVFMRSAVSAGFETVSYTVEIGSAELNVSHEGAVDLRITDITGRGIGTWTVDVSYDPGVVSLSACSPIADNTLCNLERAEDAARVTGASATGITEDITLAVIAFRCEREGETPLSLSVAGGIGIEQIIEEIDIQNGVISCSEPGATPAPTAAQPTPELPITGTGRGSGKGLDELLWVLAATGIAVLAGGAASLRRRG